MRNIHCIKIYGMLSGRFREVKRIAGLAGLFLPRCKKTRERHRILLCCGAQLPVRPAQAVMEAVYLLFAAGSAKAIQLFEIAGGVVPPGGM
jgi:hypothetical protein